MVGDFLRSGLKCGNNKKNGSTKLHTLVFIRFIPLLHFRAILPDIKYSFLIEQKYRINTCCIFLSYIHFVFIRFCTEILLLKKYFLAKVVDTKVTLISEK